MKREIKAPRRSMTIYWWNEKYRDDSSRPTYGIAAYVGDPREEAPIHWCNSCREYEWGTA